MAQFNNYRDPDIFPDTSPHWTFAPPGQFPLAFYIVQDIPTFAPFHHHHPPIYNIKQYTISVYKIDSVRLVRVRNTGQCHFSKNSPPSGSVVGQLGSGPRVVGRLRSRVCVSASFQIFALTAVGRCEWKLSGGGNVHGSGMGRPCSDFMKISRRIIIINTKNLRSFITVKAHCS